MHFHVLTLFPEMIVQGMGVSITGRAMEKGIISVNAVNIRDYSKDKHRHVDDAPYGGGAGMVMQPEPVVEAYEDLCQKTGKRPRVIYMTPQGKTFTQKDAKAFALEEDLIFLCGHYEGIDQRVLEEIVTDYMSIGDYVLTGGELPAMVMVDAISRMVPGVLSSLAPWNLLRGTFWNIPSIPGQGSGRAGRCPRFFCPGTIKISKHGAGSSPFF